MQDSGKQISVAIKHYLFWNEKEGQETYRSYHSYEVIEEEIFGQEI